MTCDELNHVCCHDYECGTTDRINHRQSLTLVLSLCLRDDDDEDGVEKRSFLRHEFNGFDSQRESERQCENLP